jgi:hypothetical protein
MFEEEKVISLISSSIDQLTCSKSVDIGSFLIYITVISLLLIAFPKVYSVELDEKDYFISNFGINSGRPFITVQGTAGGSYDPSMGDEGYEAYVFDTDKGIFQITVAQGSSSDNGTYYYSTDHILSNEIKLGECLLTEQTDDKPRFENNTAEYVGHNLNFTIVNKVYTIQVTADDPDQECSSGEHVAKIYSILTKPAFSRD